MHAACTMRSCAGRPIGHAVSKRLRTAGVHVSACVFTSRFEQVHAELYPVDGTFEHAMSHQQLLQISPSRHTWERE